MEQRVRIFVDFWNFQLNWNNHIGKSPSIDWIKLPSNLIKKSKTILEFSQLPSDLQLIETRVYASLSEDDATTAKWFNDFLDRLPGFRVFMKNRKSRLKPIHCRECNKDIYACPVCNTPIGKSVEKGIDTRIVTDLMSLAGEKAYDIAILLTQDSDFIPAVEWLQEKGSKIINGTWENSGHELAKSCWASFNINDISSDISRIR
jgi:uncharacterized LabA/DUF88 family protein